MVLVVACSSTAWEATRTAPRGPLHARWSHVSETNGCWFFSGPDGRDSRLAGEVGVEITGDVARVWFANAVFEGSLRDGQLDVGRVSTHDFESTWTVTERIHGSFQDGELAATYDYSECEAGTQCPNRCTIIGELDLVH
jgi:hypothetical protein